MFFRGLSFARIALTLGIALSVSAVAIVLGMWQYGRYEVRVEARDAYRVAVEEPAAPLNDVVPADAEDLPADAEWRTVTVTGVFEPDTTTVLRGRPIDSTAAWQYLAWLDTEDGRSVLVSVGWVPQPGPNEDPEAPEYTNGTATVTGVIRAWEEDDGKEATDSVSRITPAQVPQPHGDVSPGYLMIREYCDADQCTATVVGDEVPLPELTLGSHLSYAWQWWVFAALAPTGAVLLLRRDANEIAAAARVSTPGAAEPAPGQASAATARKPASARRKKRRSGPSDEEIEDAL
ncbi:SURF1 family protein [Demequina flava]|uniref:SURF1 family protein n=1 Tax=Demequina flava TaxID=1095025 RepID=UPI000782AF63|nr:SURF1 family cytochrome oxidase biogenesis protein [Demequina flava]